MTHSLTIHQSKVTQRVHNSVKFCNACIAPRTLLYYRILELHLIVPHCRCGYDIVPKGHRPQVVLVYFLLTLRSLLWLW